MGTEPTDSFRWWLKLQVGLLLAGGAVWLAGTILGKEFVSGFGLGLLAAAVILRLGRRSGAGDG